MKLNITCHVFKKNPLHVGEAPLEKSSKKLLKNCQVDPKIRGYSLGPKNCPFVHKMTLFENSIYFTFI